jgi:hypothetical protein
VRRITELVDAEAKDVILLAGGRLTRELLTAGLPGGRTPCDSTSRPIL